MAIKTFTDNTSLPASDINTYLNNFDNAAAVSLTSNFNISNGADTVITWSSAEYDNNTMFSAGTPDRLTIKTAGIYVVTATITWPSNSTGERISWIQKNGTTGTRWGNRRGGAWSSGVTEYSIAAQITCAVNDYIQIGNYQNSGGTLALQSAATSRTRMEVSRISAL
jgi:hypothetical protein